MQEESEVQFETVTPDKIQLFLQHCALQLETLKKIKLTLDALSENNQIRGEKEDYREIKIAIEKYTSLHNKLKDCLNSNRNSKKIETMKALILLDQEVINTAFFKKAHSLEKLIVNTREFKNRAKLFLIGAAKILAGIAGVVFSIGGAITVAGVVSGVLSVGLALNGILNIQQAVFETTSQEKERMKKNKSASARICQINNDVSFFVQQTKRSPEKTQPPKKLLTPTPSSSAFVKIP